MGRKVGKKGQREHIVFGRIDRHFTAINIEAPSTLEILPDMIIIQPMAGCDRSASKAEGLLQQLTLVAHWPGPSWMSDPCSSALYQPS